jgi:hypothetical protein
MPVEAWKSLFDWGAIILIFLTFAFGVGALYTGNTISDRQEERLRQFDKGLTDAKTDLGKQQVLASDAASRVAGLEKDAADAKTEMAKQQTRAATAEKALLELQQRLAHRRISKSDHDKFVVALLPYRGSVVVLTKLLADSEAAQFGDDIIAVLTDAKWHITLSVKGQMTPPPYGLTCSVDDRSAAGKALMTLLGALPTANIKHAPRIDGPVAEIVVGLKPPA